MDTLRAMIYGTLLLLVLGVAGGLLRCAASPSDESAYSAIARGGQPAVDPTCEMRASKLSVRCKPAQRCMLRKDRISERLYCATRPPLFGI